MVYTVVRLLLLLLDWASPVWHQIHPLHRLAAAVPAQHFHHAAVGPWESAGEHCPEEGCKTGTDVAGTVREGTRSGSGLRTRPGSRRSSCRCLRIEDCSVRWASHTPMWRAPAHRTCFEGDLGCQRRQEGLENTARLVVGRVVESTECRLGRVARCQSAPAVGDPPRTGGELGREEGIELRPDGGRELRNQQRRMVLVSDLAGNLVEERTSGIESLLMAHCRSDWGPVPEEGRNLSQTDTLAVARVSSRIADSYVVAGVPWRTPGAPRNLAWP